MLLAIGLAIPLGVLAALHRGTAVDGGVMPLAMLGQSVPSFWLGIMLILTSGWGSAGCRFRPRAAARAAAAGRCSGRPSQPAAGDARI